MLSTLVRRSLSLEPVWQPPSLMALAVLAVIGFNYALSSYRLFLQEDRRALPVFAGCQMAGIVLLAALLFNTYIGAGQWMFYRPYEGYSTFWYASILATPFLFESPWLRWPGIGAGLVVLTKLSYMWL